MISGGIAVHATKTNSLSASGLASAHYFRQQ